jgi:hypothetical protein
MTAALVRVAPDGTLRLAMGTDGLIEGPMEQCQAGRPIWNPKEKAIYLTGPSCLRKVVEKPDGSKWVEVVAGTPGKPGNADGPAKEATFQKLYRGVACNSAGVFFWLEEKGLRRIDPPPLGSFGGQGNGTVSSVPIKHLEDPRSFQFAMGGTYHGLLCPGENDEALYISDYYGYYNFRVLKVDLKTGDLIRVCGMKPVKTNKRYGSNADGPAITHAAANSGMIGVYDAFHKALWVYGPDENRFRWLKLGGDGWVRTVIGARRPETKAQEFDDNSLGIPGEQFKCAWNGICGFDSKGGVYVSHSGNPTGVWRAYNKKEAKP